MKAVLQYRASPRFAALLRERAPAWLTVGIADPADRAAYLAELAQADVLLHVLDPVTADVMAAAPRLKLVQKIGVGVNTIDRQTAKERGIAVANMPGTNSQAVAEHTLALMLAALRRLPYVDRATRAGAGWRLPVDALDHVGEINGRDIGFVGYGAVPQRLAPALRALGARVSYYARHQVADASATWMPSLEALMRQADIVSLHIPLTADTAGIIDARALSWIRPGGFLINTGRGELVDERALYRALHGGALSGAALDVFAAEPAAADNPLLHLDNVIATPHIAWLTAETLSRSLDVAMENCRRLREGEALLNQV
ncbi:Hydroxyacid dehydrogenase [Cupriavidus oxalaticus]|uniref:2-hydroxyacid dehydrogenase n=1 Tax=Cupriavidus oxalaticus TaxID=96344 RepID=UPI003F73D5B7